MWHKVSLSANRIRKQARFFRIRNQILFYRRYSQGVQRPIMFLLSSLRSMGIAVIDLVRWQPELIPPLIRGWKEGWLARDQKVI
jgi:hypothetical protein